MPSWQGRLQVPEWRQPLRVSSPVPQRANLPRHQPVVLSPRPPREKSLLPRLPLLHPPSSRTEEPALLPSLQPPRRCPRRRKRRDNLDFEWLDGAGCPVLAGAQARSSHFTQEPKGFKKCLLAWRGPCRFKTLVLFAIQRRRKLLQQGLRHRHSNAPTVRSGIGTATATILGRRGTKPPPRVQGPGLLVEQLPGSGGCPVPSL